MNTDMSRRQFVGLAGSLATVLGLGLVGCGGGADVGTAHPACLYVDPYPPSRWFSNGDSFIKQRFTGSVDSHNKGFGSVE